MKSTCLKGRVGENRLMLRTLGSQHPLSWPLPTYFLSYIQNSLKCIFSAEMNDGRSKGDEILHKVGSIAVGKEMKNRNPTLESILRTVFGGWVGEKLSTA